MRTFSSVLLVEAVMARLDETDKTNRDKGWYTKRPSLRKAAEVTGVDYQSMWRAATGRGDMRMDNLVRILLWLGDTDIGPCLVEVPDALLDGAR